MNGLMVRLVRDDQGQDLIEYALLASFLSVAAAIGAQAAGVALNDWYNALEAKIQTMITAIS